MSKLASKKPEVSQFNKLECLWNPKGASDPKLHDSYAYLDLRLDQFLSNIAQDLTFLPNAIYRPAIYVYINGKLVYRSKILDHTNDLFGESIRLKIYSPHTVVTLKLFECEEFDINSSKNPRLKQVLYYENTSRVLVSWVDLHVGLLVPEREYDVVCTFRSNPAFYEYNPGGLLYYPAQNGIPVIHTKRVCCSCKVCTLLSNRSVGGSLDSLNKYFDSTYVNGKVKSEKDAKFPSKANLQKFNLESGEPSKENATADEKTPKKGGDKKDVDILEVIDMTEGRTNSSCTCTELENVPVAVKGANYDLCLKCHDYETCCEHSLENYYTSVNLKLISSSEPIDASTEIFSSMLTPYLKVEDDEEKVSVVSIFEQFYQHYRSLQTIRKHLCYDPKVRYFEIVRFALLLLFIGLVFNRLFFTFLFFLLSFVTISVRTTSSKQFERDRGDALYVSKGLILVDEGLERAMQALMDEEIAKTQEETLTREQIERNNLNVVKHDIVDKAPIYTKMYKSYQRCENITLKTVAFLFSRSIPSKARTFLSSLLVLFEVVVVAINDGLAICRRFGVHIGILFLLLGLASVRFYRIYVHLSKLFILVLLACCTGDSLAFVVYFKRVLKHSLSYLVLTIYRREWFLNR